MTIGSAGTLPPLVPCDCGRPTVCRQDGVPTCYRCQEWKRRVQQSWMGQDIPTFKVPELFREARTRLDARDNASISCKDILEAWHHDNELKRAMETMRYDDWRRLHPHKTKAELKDG